jgi:hypothetical protein
MNDIENLRDTIDPKSLQMNADDLLNTTKVIRVTSVKRGSSKEQPVVIEYSGMNGKPYLPCKTMRRVLIAAWGEDGRDWQGRSMKLYCDPEVMFGGVKVGGIRISQMSHIDKDLKLMLSVSRAKRAESKITRLQAYPEADFTEKSPQWIAAIKAGKITVDGVIDKAAATGILTDAQIELLKGAVKDGN